MNRILVLLITYLLLGIVAAAQAPARIAIRAGKLIDARSEKPLENPLIQVEGDKIVSVTAGGRAPADGGGSDPGDAAVPPRVIGVPTHPPFHGGAAEDTYEAQLRKHTVPHP